MLGLRRLFCRAVALRITQSCFMAASSLVLSWIATAISTAWRLIALQGFWRDSRASHPRHCTRAASAASEPLISATKTRIICRVTVEPVSVRRSVPARFPTLEQKLNLPPRTIQNRDLLGRQHVRRDVGHQNRPVAPGEALLGGRSTVFAACLGGSAFDVGDWPLPGGTRPRDDPASHLALGAHQDRLGRRRVPVVSQASPAEPGR